MKKNYIKFFSLILFILLFSFVNIAKANIGFISAKGKTSNYIPSGFQLNNPLPPSVVKYLPNQKINFQMDFWTNGEGTSLRDVSIRITNPILESEDPKNYWSEWKEVGTRGRFNDYTDVNLPWTEAPDPIITPSQAGIYRIYFEINNKVSWTVGKTFNNNYIGYINIEVVDTVDTVEDKINSIQYNYNKE